MARAKITKKEIKPKKAKKTNNEKPKKTRKSKSKKETEIIENNKILFTINIKNNISKNESTNASTNISKNASTNASTNILINKINRNSLNEFERTVYDHIKLPEGKYVYYDEYLENDLKKYYKNPIGLYDPYGNNINPLTNEPYRNFYIDQIKEYQGGPLIGEKFPETYMNWAYIWSNLPIYNYATKIIDSIRNNTITFIKAGTGVGKSFLGGRICCQAFNYQKKVLMTLPKKFLARKTAEDTAKTADVILGEEVGYYFKGEYMIDKNNKESKIIFTTVGSLIRKLTGDDPYLNDYSAIIVDEAHERSVQTDELILFLKKALEIRKDLKIIFISATLNIEQFKNYYSGYTSNVIDMGEGTVFPIEEYWENEKPKDWQLLAGQKVISIIKNKEPGDILVFVKSLSDSGKIRQYIEQELKKINTQNNPFMIGLNAGVKGIDEKYVIDEFLYRSHPNSNPEKPYTRKVVFATNVAESSVTVTGIIYVIDSGLALEDLFEPYKNANALLEKYVSKSAIKQRKGRVGRTKPGVCYHLYTKKDYDNFIEYPIPAIEKSDLTMDILDIMKISYIKNFGDIKNLLNTMMSPPKEIFIENARKNLYSMQAITSNDDNATMTPLGEAITKFSGISIQMVRAIIASYYYHCKYQVIPIIVILESIKNRIENIYGNFRPKVKMNKNSVEYKRLEKEYIKKQHQFDSKYGDILTIYNIYTKFREFMNLPKEYINENKNKNKKNNNIILEGGNIGNNENNNNTNTNINLIKYTKKTYKDALTWCIENGINSKVFVKKDKNWDKVGNESRKIDRTLMSIVQPPHLRKQHYQIYKNNGGISTKNQIENEIIVEKQNNGIEKETDDIETNKINKKNNYIQYGGYQNKPFEINFFPNIKKSFNIENNILASFAHGLYINIAKKISNDKYKTCYPITHTLCRPDQKSSISLSPKPSFLFYNELVMLREDQKELKMNVVNKFPTDVLTIIKDTYKTYIPDCYKKNNNFNTKKQQHKQFQQKKQYQHKKHKRY